MPPLASETPLQIVQHGPDGTVVARADISAPGIYHIGRDASVSRIELTSPQIEDQHFAIRHDAEGLTLLVNGSTTLCGRQITRDLRLAHLDQINAGPYQFTVQCPTTTPYALARIKGTLWSVAPEAADWQVLEENGIMRHADGFNETVIVAQDILSEHSTLEKYISFQHDRMKRQIEDFCPEILACNPLCGGSEAVMTVSTLTFIERPLAQLQYFGVHGKQVAIATWTMPPGTGTKQDALNTFRERIGLMRFH